MAFWFIAIALVVVSLAATFLLTPKTRMENAKKANLGDFNFPRTEEGSPVKMFWGRIRVRDPNVLWYGNLTSVPITKSVSSGLFSKKSVTIGYNYFLTMQMGVGLPTGAGARFLRMWFDDKVFWTGDVSATGTTVSISLPELFGGNEHGGGVSGDVTFYTGTFAQNIDTHLQSVMPDSTLVPAFRGLAYILFKSFGIGEAPQLKPLSVEVESIPTALGFGAVGSEGDANPAEVIYDILRNEWGRLGFASSLIDLTSFTDAATVLAAEGNGISLAVGSSNDARDVMEEVLRQVDGVLYEDPTTRQITIKLVRNDYDVSLLDEFGPSDIIEMQEYGVQTWTDTVNQVRLVYNSRQAEYVDKTAYVQDMSNIAFQGGVRSSEFRLPGCTQANLANKLCTRELNIMSVPLTKMKVVMNRKASLFRPGSVIKITWPDYGIEQIVMRVAKMDLGELDDGRVSVDLIQDRFAVADTLFGDPPVSGFVPPVTAASAVATRRVFERTRFQNLIHISSGEITTSADNSYLQHLAIQPAAADLQFDAQVSDDAGVTYDTDREDAAFVHSALVETTYAISTAEYDTVTGMRIKTITSPTALKSATSTQIANEGRNFVMVDNEIMAYESFTDLGSGVYRLNNVWRGVLDTSPQAHAVDARIWFLDSAAFENYGLGNYVGTETLRARQITETGFASLPPGSAGVDIFTLQERSLRPYPPDQVTIDGTAHPTTVVSPLDTQVSVAWNRRDRLKTTVTLPTAADETPEGGTTYVAKWQVNGGSLNTQSMGATSPFVLDLGAYGNITLSIYASVGGRESLYPVTRAFTFSIS